MGLWYCCFHRCQSQDFGLITAITVIFSLMLSLVLLPVLMELSARSKEEDVVEKEFEPQLDDLA